MLLCLLHQQTVDVVLLHGMISGSLAYIDPLTAFRRKVQHGILQQTVIDDTVCLLKQFLPPQSEKIHTSRTAAHEIDCSHGAFHQLHRLRKE